MAKPKSTAPGALNQPVSPDPEVEEDLPGEEEGSKDPDTVEIEAGEGDEYIQPPKVEEDKKKGIRKIILKGDSKHTLYKITNTGISDSGIEVARAKGQPMARVQRAYGNEIKIGPGESIVVSQNLKRFFSRAKGYEVESYKG